MIQPKTSVRILGIGAAMVFVWFLFAIVFATPWLAGFAPVFLALWLLFAIQQGYFLLRAYRWAQMQREEREALEKLAIPEGVKKCEAFDDVKAIDDLQKRVQTKSPDYQGRYRVAGVIVALLSPMALTFLTLETLLFGNGGPWAAGFVFAEALFLATLIFLVWTSPNPTLHWIQSRLRTELIRREQYLRLGAVGPYLGLTPEEATKTRVERLDLFEKGDLLQLWQFIPLATPISEDKHYGDRRWMDELWSQSPTATHLSSPEDRMLCYLHYRIGKQLMWFSLGVHTNDRFENWMRFLLKGAVLCALVAASIHGAFLLSEVHLSPVAEITHLLAFVLPPVGAALMAIQGLFAFRTLASSYQETVRQLLQLKLNLQLLINTYPCAADEREQRRLETSFQALVLHTESALTHEMESWMMFVNRPEFEVSP